MSTSATTGADGNDAASWPNRGLNAKTLAERLAILAGSCNREIRLVARTTHGDSRVLDVTPSVHGIIVSLTEDDERALSVTETIRHLRISEMLPSRRANDDPVYVRAHDRLSVVGAVTRAEDTLVLTLHPFE